MRYRIRWLNLLIYTFVLVGIIFCVFWTLHHRNEKCVVEMVDTLTTNETSEFVVKVSNLNGESKFFTCKNKREAREIKNKDAIILLPESAAEVFKETDGNVVVFNHVTIDGVRWIVIDKSEKEHGLLVLKDEKNISLIPLKLVESKTEIAIRPMKGNINQVQVSEEETLGMVNANTPFSGVRLDLFDLKRVGLLSNNNTLFVQREMLPSLIELAEAAKNERYQLIFVSGYRNVEKQTSIFNEQVSRLKKNGIKNPELVTSKTIQYPGYSEHHTGYAIDVLVPHYTTQDFYKSNEAKWLSLNCSKYGFILRYPKGKELVTHISYEPWHFRYVGKQYACYITENNMTLEELIEKAKEMKVVIESQNSVTILVVSNKKNSQKPLNYTNQTANCKIFNISSEWVAYEWTFMGKNREINR